MTDVKVSANDRSHSTLPKQARTSLLLFIVGGLATTTIIALATLVGLQAARLNDLEDRVEDMEKQPQAGIVNNAIVTSAQSVPPAGYAKLAALNSGVGEWAPSVRLPAERSDFHAVACAGKIVLMGGLDASNSVSKNTWLFDPVVEVYTTEGLPPMPVGRYRYGAACLDGKVYVAGGYSSVSAGDAGECLDQVDVYDVARNVWTAAAPLPLPRGDLALAAAAGRVFAIGGYGYHYPYPDPGMEQIDEYDPAADSWVVKAAKMPNGGKGDIQAAAIGNKIFVPGGWNGVFLDELAVYNIGVDAWSVETQMAAARGDKAVTVLNGDVVVTGGETWSGKVGPCPWDASQECNVNEVPTRSCERYAPESKEWMPLAPLPEARFRFAAVAVGGALYTFGGHAHDKTAVNTAWAFLYVKQPDIYFHVKAE